MKIALSKKQLIALLLMATCHIVVWVINFPEFLHGRVSEAPEQISSAIFLATWFVLAFLMRNDFLGLKFFLVYAAGPLIAGLILFFQLEDILAVIVYPLAFLFWTPYYGLKRLLGTNFTMLQIGIPSIQLFVVLVLLYRYNTLSAQNKASNRRT